MFTAVVVTVSDRSYAGERPDASGPCVAELLQQAGYDVSITRIVPDEQAQIEAALRRTRDR